MTNEEKLFVSNINKCFDRIEGTNKFKSRALVEIYKVSLKNAIDNRIYKDLYGELTPEIYAKYNNLRYKI